MADNPQETIHELRALVVAYAKQETVDPLKGLAKYVGFGLAGALMLGSGITFLALGVLRLLQTEVVEPNDMGAYWSLMPYVVVIAGMLAIAALVMWLRTKRKS